VAAKKAELSGEEKKGQVLRPGNSSGFHISSEGKRLKLEGKRLEPVVKLAPSR
jgi:hypothetical protein